MAQTRKFKLGKRVIVNFDCFWNRPRATACVWGTFYFVPQIKVMGYPKDMENLPNYIVQFNWLYILADINIWQH